MSTEKAGCSFRKCPHPLYKDTEHCIFHLPKLTDKEKTKLSSGEMEDWEAKEKYFREKFYALLKDIYNDSSKDEYDFRGFQFPTFDLSYKSLRESIPGWDGFNKPCFFCKATFKGHANFRGVHFKELASFDRTGFYQQVDFSWAKFNKTIFSKTIFNETSFSWSTFKEDSDFSWSVFQGETDFSKTFFQNTNFSWAGFQDKVEFLWANFQQANFSLVKFKQADFSWAIFHQFADFSWAKFHKASFIETNFNKITNFSRATFQHVDFLWAFFKQKIDLRRSIITKSFVFSNAIIHDDINLEKVITGPDSKIVFEKNNLRKASFFGTDIEHFDFKYVQWYFRKGRKVALWDEFKNDNVDLAKLADNYHQLVLNYEKKRDFDTAMEFRIGEMEVRRKSAATSNNKIWNWLRVNLFNAHAIYKYLSFYGTSYWVALGWLGAFLAFFAAAMFFTGFEVTAGDSSRLIGYDISMSNPASLLRVITDYGSSVLYALSVFTLQKSTHYAATGEMTVFWTAIARICFYAQTTLFLLAVRRRFKQ